MKYIVQTVIKMISETATELVRGNDPSMFWLSIIAVALVYLFVYIKNTLQER